MFDQHPEIGDKVVNEEGRIFVIHELLRHGQVLLVSEDGRKSALISELGLSTVYHPFEK